MTLFDLSREGVPVVEIILTHGLFQCIVRKKKGEGYKESKENLSRRDGESKGADKWKWEEKWKGKDKWKEHWERKRKEGEEKAGGKGKVIESKCQI